MSRPKLLPVCITVLACLAAADSVHAGNWPERPVRIIYPYAAGSVGDGSARLLAQRLSQAFGQPFIVENRLGANGTIATTAVARSPADGYTLLWAITPQIAIAPAMTKLPYDPVKDFVPISAVNTNTFALVVNPKLPVTTVADFVSYVRRQPDKLVYAEGGLGSLGHLSMALLLNRAGLEMTNVSYKGNEPALIDVIAGHVPTMFSLLGDALPHATSGAIRMLAVSSEERSPQTPEVPTVAESGFPGFKTGSWMGLMAPAGTPDVIVNRIAAEVEHTVKDPDFARHLAGLGVEPLGNSPAEFTTMISADIKLWTEAVRIAGVKLQ
jgi:tripartite-type tricarboxylate transporter receptor subunit TctC